MIRRRPSPVLALAVTVLLALGAAACGDDGDDGSDATTTTEDAGTDAGEDGDPEATAEPGDTEDTGSDDTGTEGPDDTADPGDTTTTADPDVTTTSPNLTPNDSPLRDLLLPPSAVGDGYAPDDTLGDGSFDGDICEEVTIDPTFEDQAAQALLSGTGDDAVSFNQAVLRFADAAAAEEFATAVADGVQQCQPDTEVATVDGAGDQAITITDADEEFHVAGAIVRVGDLVSFASSLAAADQGTPIDDEMLAAIADRLTA